MAVRTREEILSAIKARLGDDTSDDALCLIEDFSDTINDYESRVGEDWRSKYEENDRTWRERYRERFFSPEESPSNTTTTSSDIVTDNRTDLQSESKVKSFDELFTERKENSGY